MGRYIHTIITTANPDSSKKEAIFANQLSYLNFIETWIPHLDLDFRFARSREKNINIHEELFSACSSKNPSDFTIKEVLKDHLQASLEDIQILINWIDRI